MQKQISVLLLSLILVIGFLNPVLAAVSTGEFQIGNEPPAASNLEVQDSSTHYDDYDSDLIMNTHDITPTFRWDLADPNPDPITTRICLSSSSARTCDLVSYTTLAGAYTYTVAGGILSWPACGNSKTYYIDLTPNDAQVDGATYSASFIILNSVPVVSALLVNDQSVTITHDQTPTLKWTVTDLDDGTQDRWPADTVTDSILTGGLCGESQYLSDSNADNILGETTSAIPWGTITGSVSTKDFCTRLSSFDNSACTGNLDVNLQLIDNLPNPALLVPGENLFISDHSPLVVTDSCIDFLPQNCLITPYRGEYTSVEIQLLIQDLDDDCTSASVNLQHTEKNYLYNLIFQSVDASHICTFTKSVPLTSTEGIEFFRAPGIYNLELIATSPSGSLTPAAHQWEYGSLPDTDYPAGVDLGDPITCSYGTSPGTSPSGANSIQLGQWNPGLCIATMTNWGNLGLNLEWYTTDPREADTDDIGPDTGFTCTAISPDCCSGGHDSNGCWDLSTSDLFQVDDDISQSVDNVPIDLATVNIPEQPTLGTLFQPSGGLQVCDSLFCNSLSLEETLDTYFHIQPPTGLTTGTYRTTITYTLYPI